ncbi:MAG: stage 0 sporulation protein, partial [Syntrophobacteraceae bacterium CG23_combo_of_CG06-09_8_20_14_all_50_8]
MKNTAGVKFKPGGKVYTFNAGDLPLQKDDQVIVETDSGPAIGTVATEVKAEPIDRLPVNL